jgi:3-hydroxyisobutyrate dehydrogenase-like beta-hydroxyacid dehydrogenase
VLGASPLAAQAERRRGPLEAGDPPLRFTLSLAGKDAGLVAEAAAGAGLTLPMATAALGWLRDAIADGRGDDDYSAILAYIVDRAS